MHQLDLFDKDGSVFLYGEIEKVKSSMDKRSRALFSLIAELQDQIIKMRSKDEQSV